MNKRAQLSAVTQTQLIWGIFRLVVVLILYYIFLYDYIKSIQDETIRMIMNIIIFIIGLAFVIGGGKGIMQVGKIFKFSR